MPHALPYAPPLMHPSSTPLILVIGCGSIGERHLRCFIGTNRCQVSACDTNVHLTASMGERYKVAVFQSLDDALARTKFDAAVICTPAHTHLAIARTLLKHGAHLLIEKPLAIDTMQVEATRDAIIQHERFVAIAYVYHLMPWILGARDFLASGEIGAPLHATVCAGQHFPTFRPAYRDIYYARHEHGGGAIQDALTHIVNAMEWLIGPSTRVFCDASHQALEGVTVEDTVNVSARHGNILVSYALNQFQAPNETRIHIHCERGSIAIEGHARRWGVLHQGESDWTWHQTPPMERDDLFTAQANAFLDGMEGKLNSLCTFEEAVQTLKFNQAALRSVSTGLPITLS